MTDANLRQGERVRIRAGWGGGGREGMRLGPDVYVRQEWTPVLWDDEEDPDWHKAAGLEAVMERALGSLVALTEWRGEA